LGLQAVDKSTDDEYHLIRRLSECYPEYRMDPLGKIDEPLIKLRAKSPLAGWLLTLALAPFALFFSLVACLLVFGAGAILWAGCPSYVFLS
jgi:hypothetical protein